MPTTEQNRQRLLNAVASSSTYASIQALRKQQHALAAYKNQPHGHNFRTIDAVAAVVDNPALHSKFAHIVDAVPREQWDDIVKCARYWDIESQILRLTLAATGDDADIQALGIE